MAALFILLLDLLDLLGAWKRATKHWETSALTFTKAVECPAFGRGVSRLGRGVSRFWPWSVPTVAVECPNFASKKLMAAECPEKGGRTFPDFVAAP